jgi:aryl-alcohol dehydrogenase-like predicted oxidoreductase
MRILHFPFLMSYRPSLPSGYSREMRTRTYPRTGWQVSEIGYGMWGMGGWTGSDDQQSLEALDVSIQLGYNFFDTAWAYGQGHSEELLGNTLRRHADTRLYVATKVPPKNLVWPGKAETPIAQVFPPDHIREYTEKSLRNLDIGTLDLQQLHVWSDAWADDEGWKRAVDDLKREKLITSFGISVNRWEPANVLRALDSRLVDCVQVVYNIFDQDPEDVLFPYCQEHGIAIIARVPFDEGSLTGTLTADAEWPAGDWRNLYFTPPQLRQTLDRVDRLKPDVPAGMTLPELALRFILHHPAVTTTIPGMRRPSNVRANLAVSDGQPVSAELVARLRAHRWERDWQVP